MAPCDKDLDAAQIKLLRALYHGLCPPEKLLEKPNLSEKISKIISPIAELNLNFKDDAKDFYENYLNLDQKPEIQELEIKNRIDLSELELAYLLKLSKLGVKIKFEFPIDNLNRGFSLPVNYLAHRIKKCFDSKNLELVLKAFSKPKYVSQYEAPDLVSESRFVAQIADGYLSQNQNKNKKIAICMRVLDKQALIFRDALRAHGLDLEILALPDLMGKQFDLVIITDCAHGRLSLSRDTDWPLSDSDCYEINKVMGREVLRRFEEDPLEPSLFSPRQALEPMWFLGACSAASEHLILTSSLLDPNYQAQAKSELLGLDFVEPNYLLDNFSRRLSKLEQVFESEKLNSDSYSKTNSKSRNFQLDLIKFRNLYKNKLGFNKSKPLSATKIEAFANCRFKAFVEKLLEIDLFAKPKHDIEPRLIGQIAHAALEKYYHKNLSIEKSLALVIPGLTRNPDLQNINQEVLKATLIWLKEALNRLVSNLSKNEVIKGARPIAFEKKLGPLEFLVGEDKIYLGGVADRIDQSSGSVVIIDYKLGSLSNLRIKFGASQILKTHFQIPVYLKLLNFDKKNILGYPISIKDGAPGPLINMTERLEELDQALIELLKPVLNGILPADVQEACQTCRLKRVCRV